MEEVTVLVCSNAECGGTHHLNGQGEICEVERVFPLPTGEHVVAISTNDCLAGSNIIVTRCAATGCGRAVSITGRANDRTSYPHKLAADLTLKHGGIVIGSRRCWRCKRAHALEIAAIVCGGFIPLIWNRKRNKAPTSSATAP